MKTTEFNALISSTSLDPKSATVEALRQHLVGGLSVAAAATSAEVARQAVYVALGKLPRKRCPCCRQWLTPGTKVRK